MNEPSRDCCDTQINQYHLDGCDNATKDSRGSAPVVPLGRMMVAVPAPSFGSATDRAAQFLVDAAWKLRSGYTVGGSTVTDGIARLLEDVARQLEPTVRTTYDGHLPHPDRQGEVADVMELTYEQRKALPAIYHRPAFNDLTTSPSWICAVCWDDDETTGWPCRPATAGGAAIARRLGLEHYS